VADRSTYPTTNGGESTHEAKVAGTKRRRLMSPVTEPNTARLFPFWETPAVKEARSRRQALLVVLWATWCEPCVRELPDLHNLQRASPSLTVIGVLDELPTATSLATLHRELQSFPSLNFQYYLRGSALRRELFDPIHGEKGTLPSFVLLSSTGRRLAEGRGQLYDSTNASALAVVKTIGRAPLEDHTTAPLLPPVGIAQHDTQAKPAHPSSRVEDGSKHHVIEQCLERTRTHYASEIGEAIDFYKSRGMHEDDLNGSLSSLARMISDPKRHLARSESRYGDDKITLWVDVTCVTCSLAADVARAGVQTNHRLLTYSVVGADDASLRAATILEVIRVRDPRRYKMAVEQFLSIVPDRPSAADDLAEDYLGSSDVEDIPEWKAAASTVKHRIASFGDDFAPPFADSDGIRLSRDDDAPFGQVGFDPFADKSLFNLAVEVIRTCGGRNVK
jgi:thiol-disulfide isomerase/thioredoxin